MTQNKEINFDYIFTGAGLAALMTVYKMVQSPNFATKTILLLDQNTKKQNDHTWCFWSFEKNAWQSILHRQWKTAKFACESYSKDLKIHPYQYNMIKGIDFYDHVLNQISSFPNVTFIHEKVIEIEETEQQIFVKTPCAIYCGKRILNSIFNPLVLENQMRYPALQQHFVGWFIQTKEAVFTPEKPTFMDFAIAQKGNTRFMYVLPTSSTEALVEYTLFSASILPKAAYETAIKKYLKELGVSSYSIIEKERGSIPMTCFPFWKSNTKNVISIGTAGGWTKPSTGYTFKNSDKQSDKLVLFLEKEIPFTSFFKRNKFWWYDLLLLEILDKSNEKGAAIFSKLFQNADSSLIFKFLDEETTFYEDLKIILQCPKMPFIKALFRVVLRFFSSQ